jgi:hypothetical protein
MKYVAAARGRRRKVRGDFAAFVADFVRRSTSVISSFLDYRDSGTSTEKIVAEQKKAPPLSTGPDA